MNEHFHYKTVSRARSDRSVNFAVNFFIDGGRRLWFFGENASRLRRRRLFGLGGYTSVRRCNRSWLRNGCRRQRRHQGGWLDGRRSLRANDRVPKVSALIEHFVGVYSSLFIG